MREYDDEPIYGLPALLPAGEKILWQGSPCMMGMARSAFGVRWVIGYFILLALYKVSGALSSGTSLGDLAGIVLWTAVPGALAVGVLCLLARAYAVTTIYTITDRRVVVRAGLALTTAIDLPLSVIDSAELRSHHDGTGDLVLRTRGNERPSWIMLWPNVRPLRWRHPEPMLRVIPEATLVASLLARALRADAEAPQAEPLNTADGGRSGASDGHRGGGSFTPAAV